MPSFSDMVVEVTGVVVRVAQVVVLVVVVDAVDVVVVDVVDAVVVDVEESCRSRVYLHNVNKLGIAAANAECSS